jgi:hypothetical protein
MTQKECKHGDNIPGESGKDFHRLRQKAQRGGPNEIGSPHGGAYAGSVHIARASMSESLSFAV